MMNALGKTLVLIHTVLCLIGLGWAAALYLSFVDWGWKEPRRVDIRDEKDRKDKKDGPAVYRVASEIDKRVATLRQAAKARDLVVPAIAKNHNAWRRAAEQFPKNHLFYAAELARLNGDPNPIDIKNIQYLGGDPVLEPAGLGAPKLTDPVPGINKSYKAYEADLKKVMQEIEVESKGILKWTTDAQKITFALTGKDDKGNKVKAGLYELLEREFEEQRQAKYEKDYLQPNWARALEESELFRERREILEETLSRLKKRKQ